MRLEPGQVMAVTGGGSGIGRALALGCAARGMAIAIADIEPAAARETAALVEAQGVPTLIRQVDVTRQEAVADFADAVFDRFGRCDLLCNNAGVLVLGPLAQATRQDWAWSLDVNLYGLIHGIQAFLPRMRAAGAGHILNTVSLRGIATSAGCGVYAASKFAALAVSETLRLELAGEGIGVTALCPWSVDTAILASERNRPGEAGGMSAEAVQRLIDAAPVSDITIGADKVAEVALEAVEDDEAYAITHPCARSMLRDRFQAIAQSLEHVAQRHPELP